MPITKSARKKMRQDKKRREVRKKKMALLKKTISDIKKTKDKKSLAKVMSLIDKAAKIHLIHKNKAARIKSRLTKILK